MDCNRKSSMWCTIRRHNEYFGESSVIEPFAQALENLDRGARGCFYFQNHCRHDGNMITAMHLLRLKSFVNIGVDLV